MFSCALCDAQFTRHTNLLRHRREHHHPRPEGGGEEDGGGRATGGRDGGRATGGGRDDGGGRTGLRFTCGLCSRSFARCSDLKKHQRLFHGGQDHDEVTEQPAPAQLDRETPDLPAAPPVEPPTKRQRLDQEGGHVLLRQPTSDPPAPRPRPSSEPEAALPPMEVDEVDLPTQRPAPLIADLREPPLHLLPEAADVAAVYRQHWGSIRHHFIGSDLYRTSTTFV